MSKKRLKTPGVEEWRLCRVAFNSATTNRDNLG